MKVRRLNYARVTWNDGNSGTFEYVNMRICEYEDVRMCEYERM